MNYDNPQYSAYSACIIPYNRQTAWVLATAQVFPYGQAAVHPVHWKLQMVGNFGETFLMVDGSKGVRYSPKPHSFVACIQTIPTMPPANH